MITLPPQLAKLADLVERDPTSRFDAMNGVELKARPDGRWQATGTNTKLILCVRGRNDPPPDDLAALPHVRSTKDGGTTVVVPWKVWREFFTAATKLTKRAATGFRRVIVAIGKTSSVFGASTGKIPQGKSQSVQKFANVEGRFPPVDAVVLDASP